VRRSEPVVRNHYVNDAKVEHEGASFLLQCTILCLQVLSWLHFGELKVGTLPFPFLFYSIPLHLSGPKMHLGDLEERC